MYSVRVMTIVGILAARSYINHRRFDRSSSSSSSRDGGDDYYVPTAFYVNNRSDSSRLVRQTHVARSTHMMRLYNNNTVCIHDNIIYNMYKCYVKLYWRSSSSCVQSSVRTTDRDDGLRNFRPRNFLPIKKNKERVI